MNLKLLNPANWRRSARLGFMLGLCGLMFFVEIIVGYAVHSIALIADAFHMLSDVIALVVALYAIQLAKKKSTASHLTYGWQRAEVLGALINAVFLIALCFTIFLEAIERFINPKEIESPELILIVGGAGLLVNIIGLVLFHDAHHHGHSHGHSHSHESETKEPKLKSENMHRVDSALSPCGFEMSNAHSERLNYPIFNNYPAEHALEELA
jgi:zinc transporter 1